MAFTQETRVRVPIAEFFFAFCARARVCARPRAFGALGARVCAPARVWGFGDVVCLWGFGAGWGARGVCGGMVTRVEDGGFDFFLPKKGPTGPVSAGPAGPRRDHAGAKARGAPAPRRRVPRRHLAFTPRARRRSRMRSMVTTAVSQTVEEEASLLEKDYHTPPRPNASSRSSRNVPELCTYDPPSTTWTPPLAFSSATF